MKVVDEIIESLHNGVSRNDKGFRDNCEKLIQELLEKDRVEQLKLHLVSGCFTADNIKDVYDIGRAHEKNNSDCTSDIIKEAWVKANDLYHNLKEE